MVLYTPTKVIHIGKGKNLGAGGNVPPNVLRMFVQTDKFKWSLINNTAPYTVDYGDGNTYSGSVSGAVNTVEHIYSSAGLYTVDFIFNDITDITRFQILDIGTGEFIQSFVNLDKTTNIAYLSMNGTKLQQSTVNVVGTSMTFIDFLGTNVQRLNMSGVVSNAGSFQLSARSMPELLSIVFPTLTDNYASCLLNDNPKVTAYDLTGEGAYSATVYRFSNCTLLQSITFSSTSTTRGCSEFTAENLPNVVGDLDVSRFGGFGSTFSVRNTAFSAIILPAVFDSSVLNTTVVLLNDNPNIEEYDLTPFGAKFGGLFRCYSCSSLNSLLLPTSSRAVTVEAYDLDSLTSLDLSPLSGMGASCNFNGGAIQTVTFPTTTGSATNFTILYGFSNQLTAVDFSPLADNFAGLVNFSSNPNLASVTLPASAETVSNLTFSSCALPSFDITPLTGTNNNIVIQLQNNVLTASAVNQLLVDLDTKGWTGGSLNIAGTGNAAPDGTSGGNDGLTAKANLISKGWSITNN
ncbi:MAG: leucine-rich repeat protein [Candidatus Riesia sp.]|nr:leucine-rich repeat protein [Candidatus Riesia sp.]